MEGIIYDGPFAGWESYCLAVTDGGAIRMDRFGSYIDPDEAEAVGVALIKAAVIAKERRAARKAIKAA